MKLLLKHHVKSEDGLKIAYENSNFIRKESQEKDDFDFDFDFDFDDFDVYETDDEIDEFNADDEIDEFNADGEIDEFNADGKIDEFNADGEIDEFNIDEIDNTKGRFTIHSHEIDDSTGTNILYFDIDIENPEKYSGSDDPRLEEDLKRFFNDEFPEFKFSMDMIEIDLEVANRAQGMTTESIDVEAFSVSDLTINFPVFKKKSN
jgi:hypothetical protein